MTIRSFPTEQDVTRCENTRAQERAEEREDRKAKATTMVRRAGLANVIANTRETETEEERRARARALARQSLEWDDGDDA